MESIVISGACRTPISDFQGVFPPMETPQLRDAVPATTLNRMCGSGMMAAMMAYDALATGSALERA